MSCRYLKQFRGVKKDVTAQWEALEQLRPRDDEDSALGCWELPASGVERVIAAFGAWNPVGVCVV